MATIQDYGVGKSSCQYLIHLNAVFTLTACQEALTCSAACSQVGKGDLVYDPFVGTGSILVAASHVGSITMGADIDIRVVRDGHVEPGGQVGQCIRLIQIGGVGGHELGESC